MCSSRSKQGGQQHSIVHIASLNLKLGKTINNRYVRTQSILNSVLTVDFNLLGTPRPCPDVRK